VWFRGSFLSLGQTNDLKEQHEEPQYEIRKMAE